MLRLTLLANDMGAITWYMDAFYACNYDCKGQSGGMMVIGEGAIPSFSCKQKLYGESSIEAELIGIDDALPQVIWTSYFLDAQCFTILTNMIMQDNMSAMKLKNTISLSSS